jgi:lipoprotein-anchoring transpeptidase ErfK/SrfK
VPLRLTAAASLAAALGLLALSGCAAVKASSGRRPQRVPTSTTNPVRTTTPVHAPPGPSIPAGATLLANIEGSTPAYAAPGGSLAGRVAAVWDRAPSVLPVIGRDGDWLHVRLPQRPNGSTTWLRKSAVRLSYTPYSITIEEKPPRLLLYRYGKLAGDFPAGIGTPTDPTPTGSFFVAYFAEPPSPGYGPFVMVSSAHSNSITDWESSGDAEIAIHGPLGMDAAIGASGARISHGCVRLHLADLMKLRGVPVGTPITIIAA